MPSEVRSHLPIELSRVKGQMEPGQICAYNLTREGFLGLNVVAGDFPAASFHDWMATLKPNSGAGMWMVPFRGIPATEVIVPLDLLYLNEDCQVLEAVEFFPTYHVSPACPPAASVLALPNHSIFASQTQAGDRLIVCRADEMDWRLEQFSRTGTMGGAASSAKPSPTLGPVLVREEPMEPAGPVLVREQPNRVIAPPPVLPLPLVREAPKAVPISQATLPAPVQPVTPQPVTQQPVQPQTPQKQPNTAKPWMDPARQPAKPALGRLGRWLFGDPADPRVAARLPVAGLVAHFFTGGAPQAHEIRDVSSTGLYVITTERWYPGTIIRMTLTKPDTGQAPTERSITIQARSVRWGNDGVGLEFVLDGKPDGKRSQAAAFEPVDGEQLGRFLKRLGGAKQ